MTVITGTRAAGDVRSILRRAAASSLRRMRGSRCSVEPLEDRRLMASAAEFVDVDDQIAEAPSIGTNVVQAARTNVGPDVNLRKITVTAGQRVAFDVDRASDSGLDSYLRLFNASGTQLAANDNGAAPGETLRTDAFLSHTFATAGTYYVGVSGKGNQAYNPVTGAGDAPPTGVSWGSYTLTTTSTQPPAANVVMLQAESAWLRGGTVASTANAGYTGTGYADFAGAGSYAEFTLNRGTAGVASLAIRYANGSTASRPFDVVVNGATVGQFACPPTGGGSTWSTLTLSNVALAAGTNVIRLVAVGAGADLDALTVTSPPSPDDTISANTPTLPIGQRNVVGRTIDGRDVQIWKFNATAGRSIEFDITRAPNSPAFNPYLRLFDASGNQLAASPNPSTSGSDPFLTYAFNRSGVYYVGISGNGNTSYDPIDGTGDVSTTWGTYTITTFDFLTVPLDNNDRIATATPTALNTTITGKQIPVRNVDMYGFDVTAGQRVTFDVDEANGSLDSVLRLFDSAGSQIGFNDNGAAAGETLGKSAFLAHTFARAGRYYVGVSGKGNEQYDPVSGQGDHSASTGPYALDIRTATAVAPTDGDDRIATAVNVPLNRTYGNQDVAFATDVDFVKLTVTAGQRIGFDVDRNGSPLDGYLRLFNASGTQLAANDNGAAPGEGSSVDPYLAYTFATAGTYYVAVSGKGNQSYNPTTGAGDAAGSTGAYSLSVQDLAFGGVIDAGGFEGVARAVDVALDAAGNRYVLSYFTGTVDFDPNQGVRTLSSRYEARALAKYSPDNRLLYVRPVAQSTPDREAFDQVAVGPDGTAYIGWNINTRSSYDPSNYLGVDRITPDGKSVTTVYSQAGVSEGYPLSVRALAVAPNGVLYIGGYFGDPGSDYGFLTTVNPDGSPGELDRSYFGSSGFAGLVVAPSGDLYAAVYGLAYSYGQGIGLHKLNGATGDIIWGHTIGTDRGTIGDVAYDAASRRVYLSGSHRDFNDPPVDFDPITPGSQSLPAGDFVWSLTEAADGRSVVAGRAVSTVGSRMALDAAGNVYAGGAFSGTVDANPATGSGNVANVTSAGGTDVLVTKLTGSLAFTKASRLGGAGNETLAALTGRANDVFLAGSYRGTVDFDTGPGTANRTAQGEEDAFVLRLLA